MSRPASGAPRGSAGVAGARVGYREHLNRLGAAQKDGTGVPPYTRYVNRPLGRRLAAAAAGTRVSPNGVSMLSLGVSFMAMVWLCTMRPSAGGGLLVGTFLLLGYALDSADGQLARLRARSSPAGEWLDHVGDQARQVSLHLSVLVYTYRFVPEAPAWLLSLPMGFAVVVSTRFIGQILAEQLRRINGTMQGLDSGAARRAVLQLPSDAGVICLVFLLSGWPVVFLSGYALLLVANTALTVVSLRRRFVELSNQP